MLNETDVQLLLWKFLGGDKHKVIYPNANTGDYESDLLAVNMSDILYEYEIKLNESDLKADAKKSKYGKKKHDTLQKSNDPQSPRKFVFVTTFVTTNIPDWAGHYLILQKDEMQTFLELDVNKKIRWYSQKMTYNDYYLVVVKKPKDLHKHKILPRFLERLQRNVMYKYWNIKEKDFDLKFKREKKKKPKKKP